MKKLLLFVMLVAMLWLTACGAKAGQPQTDSESTYQPDPKSDSEAYSQSGSGTPKSDKQTSETEISDNSNSDVDLSESHTNFAFALYDKLIQQETNKNLFISPLSISMALEMVYNGADGETQKEMAQALQLQGLTLKEINKANANLIQQLQTEDQKVQFRIANSLWAKQGISFQENFIDMNKNHYNAQVTELDFSSSDAVKTINRWVREQTNQKIEKIVQGPIDPYTILFLINAVYFKGGWQHVFDEDLTEEQSFYLADGTEKQHPFMSQKETFPYYKGEDFQSVQLPYGNGRFGMYIFLPDKDSSLQQFYRKLSLENWKKWVTNFRDTEGEISLPKFKQKFEVQLKETLEAMGMETAFNANKENFSKMLIDSDMKPFISGVKHKAFIGVDEKGTEAAAVTSVIVKLTSAVKPKPAAFKMNVDRPFFFAIRDNQTGSILFMGSVMEP